ncbi:uncharacterized protein PHACADRAFT_169913 [Phanerochaete carnosa HHB-10118-sp]|uniref:Uncharacterized protein n=1 Tax=Phanerochaete carnosa (strain HHB-10118-sp) TaxID=650164 RepID=K5X931_PHACS|nr:uncharacterized protein PHACADRAFT_169913 [Phanerochaete carnosa HHB-10118-sp]EKM59367.1 hypothetical protein PHACADRAFT_169913 [Phanerochaete carnosa HHB-10118-sp]
MVGFRLVSLVALTLATALVLAPSPARAFDPRAYSSLEARYARAHSLGDSYQFDPRDGWQTVNATNLQYKYSRDYGDPNNEREDDWEDDATGSDALGRRASKKSKSKSKSTNNSKSSSKSKSKSVNPKSAASKVTSSIKKIVDTMKGTGKSEPVTITWYTGHDLENPSCWSNPSWAPTDASFACALTLDGWTTKPKCFKFLERNSVVCNSPKKCVFVRVVDSCAGCAKDSKHVDLTQAAFEQLADLDTGLLTVQMRPATDPDGWLEDLWGPKA